MTDWFVVVGMVASGVVFVFTFWLMHALENYEDGLEDASIYHGVSQEE